MHRGLACWVAGLLVVATLVAPAASAGTPDGAFGVGQEEFEPDNVTLSASLDDDGSAAWSFKYRMELATDNETAAFESLQQDVEQNRSDYVDRFRSRIENTVASAENATGREMSVENVSVRAFQQPGGEFVDSYGFVEYTFEWNGFAAVEGDRITAGDALEGFYLNNETALQLSWKDSYEAMETDPPGDESSPTSVRWTGPQDFGTGQPSLVIEESETAGATTTTTTTTTAGGTAEDSGTAFFPVLVGAAIAAVVLGGGAWVYWHREEREGGTSGPTASAGEGGGPGGPGDGGEAAGTGGSESGGGDGAGTLDGAAAGEAVEETAEELLSNEERVERFLREQGGRAKQQDVVEAMDWTEAKTSQVVKSMREDDELESFRIGRENVLKLPDVDPDEE